MTEPQKNYYAIIPANVRYDKELTPNAKLLYGEITALCNEKGYCWAGNSYFADLYSVSKKSISTWVNQLVEKGYLMAEIEYRPGSKEILHRYLRISNDPMEEKFYRYRTKLPDPMEEKVTDNNTSNNTKNKKEASSIPYSKIIAYLNDKTGKSYRAVGKNKELIKARWNEGYTLEDFERVIDNKVATWKGVTFQDGTLGDRYLQPTTLFGGKFDGYLNETQPKKASKMIDEEMGGNDKYQQYLERKGLAAANNQQPTA